MDFFHCITLLIIGLLLGGFYFGGLWLTTQKISKVKRPAMLLMGSFLIRVVVVLYVLYLFSDNNFINILTLMIGFIASRFITFGYLKRYSKK